MRITIGLIGAALVAVLTLGVNVTPSMKLGFNSAEARSHHSRKRAHSRSVRREAKPSKPLEAADAAKLVGVTTASVQVAQAAPVSISTDNPPINAEYQEKLRLALEKMAKGIAGTGSIVSQRQVSKIIYDVESGIKSVIYSDGSMVEENFDIAQLSVITNNK